MAPGSPSSIVPQPSLAASQALYPKVLKTLQFPRVTGLRPASRSVLDVLPCSTSKIQFIKKKKNQPSSDASRFSSLIPTWNKIK